MSFILSGLQSFFISTRMQDAFQKTFLVIQVYINQVKVHCCGACEACDWIRVANVEQGPPQCCEVIVLHLKYKILKCIFFKFTTNKTK